ncbi:MAG TPA: ELWxxDGT repeat protein, partial [Thermoanaerobaculia bacterium]|nr:ELWxxDGT repeat protein [Thermoanaerobaculia bacterium]
MSAKAWILAAAFVLAAPSFAITPYLVKDIDPRLFVDDSNPRSFVSLGGRVLLCSDTGIWASDGTPGGTVQLANERFSGFLAVGKKVAYAIEGDSFQFRLWVTDGTPAGTLPLTGSGTVLGLPQRDYRGFLAPGTERLFFAAGDGIRGGELWTSDGTAGGTRMVADLAPGLATSNPQSITSFRDRIFFVADDGRGASLWSVDAAGTNPRLIKDFDPQNRQLIPPSPLR